MKVELIDYQENALDLLLFTKDTRLAGCRSLKEVAELPIEQKLEHLAYMRDTIQSSWEFVKYMFKIEGVTRNFTHQFVRTRTQSYAQESGRAVDMRDHTFGGPNFQDEEQDGFYEICIKESIDNYATAIDNGMEVQKARDILPSSIHTSIIVGTDLRTLHNTALVRLCYRTQGEYQEVFKAMRDEVIKVHPWAEDFIQVACAENNICAFPNYTECPLAGYTYNNKGSIHKERHEIEVSVIKDAWENTIHTANPIAKQSKTMD
jgi:flavin-dependent thymidylate synthase